MANDIYSQGAADALREVRRAHSLNTPLNSAHEGYAVLLEELDELRAHVWMKPSMRDYAAMRHEAVQVAAAALAFIAEVCDVELAQEPPK